MSRVAGAGYGYGPFDHDEGVSELQERVWDLLATDGWTDAQIQRVVDAIYAVECERRWGTAEERAALLEAEIVEEEEAARHAVAYWAGLA